MSFNRRTNTTGNIKAEELLHSYFKETDIVGLTHGEFQIAMIGLIDKGLMEMVEKNGMTFYRPTSLARTIKTHLHSPKKDRS